MHVAATCPVPPSRLVWHSLLVRRSTAASHGFPRHVAGHPPGSPKDRSRTRKIHQSELTPPDSSTLFPWQRVSHPAQRRVRCGCRGGSAAPAPRGGTRSRYEQILPAVHLIHRELAEEVAAEPRCPELASRFAVPCADLVVATGAKHET